MAEAACQEHGTKRDTMRVVSVVSDNEDVKGVNCKRVCKNSDKLSNDENQMERTKLYL